MNTVGKYTAIKILAVIGIGLAVFLMWEQIFRPPFQPCYVNSYINCNAVISGEVSKTLGIPTPLFGLVGYIVILYAAFRTMPKLVLSMAVFGLAFCMWIAFRELVQLRVICPVCIGCQVDMIVTFVLAILLQKKLSPPAPTS
jgi:uncharacterized membrane protein